MSGLLLRVQNLHISVRGPTGGGEVVSGLDLQIGAGQIIGLAGESGCGKSVTALALTGLLPVRIFDVRADAMKLGAEDLLSVTASAWRRIRGGGAAMIFQDPATALDPVFTVGRQIAAAARHARGLTVGEARTAASEALEDAGFSSPAGVHDAYPHELSGGMRQLCMIAMAFAARPSLLIADEPTTALDVTTQARILQQIANLRERLGTAVLLISHDLGVIAQCADQAMIMHEGHIVEQADCEQLFSAPRHPYTRELLRAVPRLNATPPAVQAHTADTPEIIEVDKLRVEFKGRRSWLRKRANRTLAVDGVSFELHAGEIFGLAGESGSGKSTLARSLMQLLQPTGGYVRLDQAELGTLDGAALQEARRRMQIVFQDPATALSPRRTIRQTLLEPLEHFGIEADGRREDMLIDALETVGLDASALPRYPHQFSSGQRQRVSIARALIAGPDVLIADEAVSALDVSVQAKVLELLKQLRKERNIAILFISHDLAVIRQLADTVGIMYRGRLVECAPAEQVFSSPLHPYTVRLLDSVPHPDPSMPMAPLSSGTRLGAPQTGDGCAFRHQCPQAMEVCATVAPTLAAVPNAPAHHVECHLHRPEQIRPLNAG